MLDSEDESLYDNIFELEIRTTTEEEPDWYNTTLVKVSYRKPPCEVSQIDIDSIAAGIEILQVNATRGLEQVQVDYSQIL